MATPWRKVGLNYVQYSNIAARILRSSLKTKLRAKAAHRNECFISFIYYENGKPVPVVKK